MGLPLTKVKMQEYIRRRILECEAHAKLCKTKGEFKRRFPADFIFSRHRRIKYPWLVRETYFKYSDEIIIQAARKYKYKADFRNKMPRLYLAASRRGLIPQLSWLKTSPNLFSPENCVYRYYFRIFNAVYVGRTIKPSERDRSHRSNATSTVYRFAHGNGVEIPKMQVLRKGLNGEDSQILEDAYIRRYREHGMLVLNKGATGAGTGSMGMKRRFSKKAFMRTARHYTSYTKFKLNHPSLWRAGERNGWIKECTFLQRDVRLENTLTKRYCMEVARQYPSRSKLNDGDPSVYAKMLDRGWLELCTWFTRRLTRSYEYCMAMARKCKSARELYLRYGSVSQKMYAEGWIKDCTWFKTPGPPESHMRKVRQFTKDGVFVAEYRSAADASRATGANAGKITAVCRGRRPWTNGFIWKYA